MPPPAADASSPRGARSQRGGAARRMRRARAASSPQRACARGRAGGGPPPAHAYALSGPPEPTSGAGLHPPPGPAACRLRAAHMRTARARARAEEGEARRARPHPLLKGAGAARGLQPGPPAAVPCRAPAAAGTAQPPGLCGVSQVSALPAPRHGALRAAGAARWPGQPGEAEIRPGRGPAVTRAGAAVVWGRGRGVKVLPRQTPTPVLTVWFCTSVSPQQPVSCPAAPAARRVQG